MKEDKVLVKDIVLILKEYLKPIFLIVFLSVGFCIQLTYLIPKKYKAEFEINVYSKYFQNPLISAIVPGVYSVPEMRFTIDSMIKEAISDEFIDVVGYKYKLYSDSKDAKIKATERQVLRDRFSYFSTGGQSYKITFTYSDPFVAKDVAKQTLDLVKGYLIQTKINTIEMVKEVMVKKLTSFNASQTINKKGVDKALISKSPEVLNAELSKINSEIDALKKQYKSDHPKILNLNEKKKIINSWLEEFDDSAEKSGISSAKSDIIDATLAMSSNKEVSEQISSKFYTKYHDFNIALEIEKRSLDSYIGIIQSPNLPTAPIWPKKRLFASVGFLLGLVFAFLYVFFKEVIMASRRESLALEVKKLNSFSLGILPVINTKAVANPKEVSKEADIHLSNN